MDYTYFSPEEYCPVLGLQHKEEGEREKGRERGTTSPDQGSETSPDLGRETGKIKKGNRSGDVSVSFRHELLG